jgi:hypothetical protein
MKRHIHGVIASGNKEIEQYIIMWMADLVQNPGGQRPGTAIVLRGKQGTGKGSFVSELGRIIGPHYLHITNQHQLTGRFNNHLKDALLIFVDEGFWGGDKTIEGPLKGLVTEDQIMIEPKGKDPFMVQNHIRLIIASNNDWVVPAGLEERRFFVIDVADDHIQDRGYFRQLFRQMKNGGREAMLHDLLHMNISGYDLRSFPRTGALFDQIFRSMSSFEQFWYEQLWSGTLGSAGTIWRNSISVRELHEEYIEFCKNRGLGYRQNMSQMGKELKKLCPGMDKKRKKVDKNVDRIAEYIIPKLDECRKAFEERVKVELAWDKLE